MVGVPEEMGRERGEKRVPTTNQLWDPEEIALLFWAPVFTD